MPTLQYPFDPTGLAVTNYVASEHHPVTEVNFRDFFYIVPDFAPFIDTDKTKIIHYALNADGTLKTEGVELRKDLDYYAVLTYQGATRELTKPVYGGFSLNSRITDGVVAVFYQALGGTWTADRNYVLEALSDRAYNPRVTLWDNVTNVQDLFPPINHDQDFDDMLGQKDLIASIDRMTTELGKSHDSLGIVRHLMNQGSLRHLTDLQATTLEKLEFDPETGAIKIIATMASKEEALAGLDTVKAISPATLKTVVDSLSTVTTEMVGLLAAFKAHVEDITTNPHHITASSINLGEVVNLPLATDSEIAAFDPTSEKLVTLRQVMMLLKAYAPSTNTTTIVPEDSKVQKGKELKFMVAVSNMADGTLLSWAIENITTTSADFLTTTGAFVVTGGMGTFTVGVSDVVSFDIPRTFRVSVTPINEPQKPLAQSSTITVSALAVYPYLDLMMTPSVMNADVPFDARSQFVINHNMLNF